MDRLLYVAMSGARETLLAQGLTTNNLANAGTTGFRADLLSLRSMPVFGEGLPTRAYSMAERPGIDLSSGQLVQTGNELDVTVSEDGWIGVRAKTGEEFLVRSARINISTEGLLRLADGSLVLGDDGPISLPPYEKVEIGTDGTISIRPLGGAAVDLEEVDRLRLLRPTPAQVEKDASGRIRLVEGTVVEPDASLRVTSGAIEGSNVSMVDALVDMITLARRFEVQVKMMAAAADNARTSDKMLRSS